MTETAEFLQAMRRFASSVCVVTVGAPGGRAGLTATSACSVSAEPPRFLVCVNRKAEAHGLIEREGRFAVNLLTEGQRRLADRFAGRDGVFGEERFADPAWRWGRLATGAPVLDGAAAVLDCRVNEILARGSHSLVLGDVVAARPAGAAGGGPLLYHDGGYRALAEAAREPVNGAPQAASESTWRQ